MDEKIKRLNPSVNYNQMPHENNKTVPKHLNLKGFEDDGTDDQKDKIYRYFSFLMIVIFFIIILNVTVLAYKMVDPEALEPCKTVMSPHLMDAYSSVYDRQSAERALIKAIPDQYEYEGGVMKACGRYGMYSYHFRSGNTTYMVCEDETIRRKDTVCENRGFFKKKLIGLFTILS